MSDAPKPAAQLDGPSLAETIAGFLRDPQTFLLENQKRYGDIYRLPIGGDKTPLVILNHPHHAQHILRNKSTNYQKEGDFWDAFRSLIGHGIATIEGEHWLRQRRMMQPHFHRQSLLGLVEHIVDAIEESLDPWEEAAQLDLAKRQRLESEHIQPDPGSVLEVTDLFQEMILKIVVRAIFGSSFQGNSAARALAQDSGAAAEGCPHHEGAPTATQAAPEAAAAEGCPHHAAMPPAEKGAPTAISAASNGDESGNVAASIDMGTLSHDVAVVLENVLPTLFFRQIPQAMLVEPARQWLAGPSLGAQVVRGISGLLRAVVGGGSTVARQQFPQKSEQLQSALATGQRQIKGMIEARRQADAPGSDWLSRVLHKMGEIPLLNFAPSLERLDTLIDALIEERRQQSTPSPDILSMLVHAVDDQTNERMTNKQLRDEVLTLLLGATDTTSLSIAWTIDLLMYHPDVLQRVQAEVDAVVGTARPRLEHMGQMTYTRFVLQESLRMRPPAWFNLRRVMADDEIDGVQIPEGSTVIMPQFVLHHRQDLWDHPYTFKPERFDTEFPPTHGLAWLPFITGPHQCIGRDLAMMEDVLIIISLLQRYDLSAAELYPARPSMRLELHPNRVRVWVKYRDSWLAAQQRPQDEADQHTPAFDDQAPVGALPTAVQPDQAPA